MDSTIISNLENKIEGRILLKIDMLDSLKELWGPNVMMARDILYKIVSGCVEEQEYLELLTSYYKRFSAFANYVDYQYMFGEEDTPLLVKIIKPIREKVCAYQLKMEEQILKKGGKVVGVSHDYIYAEFWSKKVPCLDGSIIV